jgi:hypothetical protein
MTAGSIQLLSDNVRTNAIVHFDNPHRGIMD